MYRHLRLPLRLSVAQHAEAAMLIKRVNADLCALGLIVSRAAFVDRTLGIRRCLQESVVDALAEAWGASGYGRDDSPYPSINFVGHCPRRRPGV